MNGMQHTVVRFCPACGEKLPPDVPAKFCPFCGGALPLAAGASCSPTAKAAGVRGQAGQGARAAAALEVVLPEAAAAAASYYSVVIKHVPDPLRLTQALLPYLARGATAIRMAAELAPAVLIYKGKKAEVDRILPVLAEEKVCYTVIKGDFERETPARRVLPGFLMLPPDVQSLLERVPSALWLGERATAVLPEAGLEGADGCLVVTNWHLYFLTAGDDGARVGCRMWPLGRIVAQDQWQEQACHHTDLILDTKEALHFTFRQMEAAHKLRRAIQAAAG